MHGKSFLLGVVRGISHSGRCYSSNGTKKLLEFLAAMPKENSPRISEVQRQRQQIAKKADKYGSSTVYLQVLGSGARGAPNTLYLFTDQKRYLFNCGEQTQRLAHEHKVKLSRLDHIFITAKTWRNIGGLPGLSLTLQDVGVPSLTLHGPEGLDDLYNATSRFVIMKDMNVTMAKCSPTQDFEDNVMTVKYVVLNPNDEKNLVKDLTPAAKRPKMDTDALEKDYEEFIHDDTDYYRQNQAACNRQKERGKAPTSNCSSPERVPNDSKKGTSALQELLVKKHNNSTVCYICTLKKRLGTLDLTKCVEFGVKPGPLLGQLKNGQDVVLPDGTIVHSKDVKTPDDPGPVFIVLEVPDISYLKEDEFAAHFADGSNPEENIPTLIVHYTPPDVFHTKKYQEFMLKFGPTTRHLVLNAQNSCLGSEAVHRTQHKLHLLDPDIFPLLKDASVPAEWTALPSQPKPNNPVRIKGLEELKNKIAIAQFQNILNMETQWNDKSRPSGDASPEQVEFIVGRTLTMFHLRPRKQLDRSAEPKLRVQEYISECMDEDGFVSSLENFRRVAENTRYSKGIGAKEYPKVVFLGTGSCIPSKTRNTSGIVIQFDENRSIMLDCGEGTFGQLVRFYGPKRVNSFLRTLRAIYISHLHADHHIGLIGVLQARRQAFDEINSEVPPEPVYLLAPGQIVTWLTIYDQQFERIRSEFSLIPNQNLVANTETKTLTGTQLTPEALSQIGVTQVRTCFVPHCPNAFGVSVDVGENRLTYSGDTLPCEALIKLGENSTLLIHEATMEDELADEARMKMHCTTTQAIEVGRQMNAKYTVLTHFSQRYARLPRLNAKILNDNTSVGIAFDNMQITMNDLELLPHMYAPLQLMFAEHCVELELKAANRARKKKRAEARRSGTEIEPWQKEEVSPDVSEVPKEEVQVVTEEPKEQVQNNQTSATVAFFQPSYRESHSSRLRAEAWSINRAAGERPALHRRSLYAPKARAWVKIPAAREADIASAPKTAKVAQRTQRPLACRTPSPGLSPIRHSSPTPLGNNAATGRRPSSPPVRDKLADHRSSTQKNLKPNTQRPSSRPASPTGRAKCSNEVKGFGTSSRPSSPTGRAKCTNAVKGYKTSSRPPSPTLRAKCTNEVKVSGPSSRAASPTVRANCTNEVKGFDRAVARLKQKDNQDPIRRDFRTRDSSVCSSSGSSVVSHNEEENKTVSPEIKKSFSKRCNFLLRLNESQHSSICCRGVHVMVPRRDRGDKRNCISCHSSPARTRPVSPTAWRSSPASRAGDTFNELTGRDQDMEAKSEISGLMFAQLCQQAKTIQAYRLNSTQWNNGFKPQLEDIKSSLVLQSNKTQQLREMARKLKGPATINKPQPLNEQERRIKLLEAKRKFQSMEYLQDQRYEKIEGLNWITWK